jgi:hypothetical protein
MIVNLSIALTDIEGNKIKNENGQEVSLSKMVGNALFAAEEKEDPIRLYELAKKIYYSEGEMEISKSDADLVKEKVKTKGFTVLVLGPLYEALKEK